MTYEHKVINEKRSFTEYTVSSPTQSFVIGFELYEDEQHIHVTLNNTPIADLGYTFVVINSLTIEVTPAIHSGVLRIQRETDIDDNKHKFSAGAIFNALSMDENFEQIRHSQQEVRDNFSSLEERTSVRLDTFSDQVNNLNNEFISTRDVVSDLVIISADTVTTANTALDKANAVDAKASTALSNSSTALSTATGIDAKATDALDNSLTAVLNSSAALNTANAVDGKATQALADAATALSSATTAVNTANAVDGKATQALADAAVALTAVVSGALKSSNNLSDVSSATVSRANLGVMSSSEVTTAIANATANATLPDATESTAGKAKIATTAIARAGTNDTDFITAKKLRDALNATGGAPISACRAWVNFSASGGVVTVKGSLNIASVTRVSVGVYTVNFSIPMPIAGYAVFISNSGSTFSDSRVNASSETANPTIKTVNSVQVAVNGIQSYIDPADMSVGVFC